MVRLQERLFTVGASDTAALATSTIASASKSVARASPMRSETAGEKGPGGALLDVRTGVTFLIDWILAIVITSIVDCG
jgi:hypothetical protein